MSTVLWANVLVDGEVRSDETDHLALYKHADKLDAISRDLKLPSFRAVCDTTDMKFNADDDLELPDGMTSTRELMAVQGAWMPMPSAVAYLETLRDHIVTRKVRFGLLSNQHAEVVAELDEVLAFVKAAPAEATKFNFAVIM